MISTSFQLSQMAISKECCRELMSSATCRRMRNCGPLNEHLTVLKLERDGL